MDKERVRVSKNKGPYWFLRQIKVYIFLVYYSKNFKNFL